MHETPHPAVKPKKSRALIVAAAALLIAVGAYWYWSPFWAIHQFRSAAEVGDAKALNARVDFPSVRENLKAQMRSRIAPQMSQNSENPFAALGTMFGVAMVNQMVDMFVRPEVLAQAVKTGKMRAAEQRNAPAAPNAAASAPSPAAKVEKPATWRYEREGVDRLTMYTAESSGEKAAQAGFVFERTGFANWRLTEIKLPE